MRVHGVTDRIVVAWVVRWGRVVRRDDGAAAVRAGPGCCIVGGWDPERSLREGEGPLKIEQPVLPLPWAELTRPPE